MATATFTETVIFEVVACCDCHVQFALTQDMEQRLRKNGALFYCPNGHSQWYGMAEADKLREELKAKEKELTDTANRLKWAKDDVNHYRAEAKAFKGSLTATKGVLTRTKNRIANGVCPCCQRTFVDLHRHMAGQHPEYVDENEEDAALGEWLSAPDTPAAPEVPDAPAAPKRGRPRKVLA